MIGGAIEQHRAIAFRHQEIEQDLALGCEQGGIEAASRRKLSHIVRDKALQEVARFTAFEGNDGAILEVKGFHHREVMRPAMLAKSRLPSWALTANPRP